MTDCKSFRHWFAGKGEPSEAIEARALAHLDSCPYCAMYRDLLIERPGDVEELDSAFATLDGEDLVPSTEWSPEAARALRRLWPFLAATALHRLAHNLTEQRLPGWAFDQVTGAWNRGIELARDAFQPVARPSVAVLGRDDEDYRWVAPGAVLTELGLERLYSEIAVEVRTGAGEPRASLIVTPVEGVSSVSTEHDFALTALLVDERDMQINKRPMRLRLGSTMRSAPVVLARIGDPRRFRGSVRLGLSVDASDPGE